MFTYNAQELNNEYRKRQEANAQQQQLVNQMTENQPTIKLNLRHLKTIASALVTVALCVVIFLSAGQTAAQDSTTFSGGDAGEGQGGGIEVLYLVVAVDALREGDFEKALRNFDASIESNPEYEAAYAGRAIYYLVQDDVETALVDALIGYDVNPESAEIHFVLGAIYYEMGQFENSRSHYQLYLVMVEAAESEPALMEALFAGNGVALVEAQIASSNEYLLAVGG